MAEELGFVGEEYDLVIRQGQTFVLEGTLLDALGEPYNLTGCTLQSEIRRRALDELAVESFAASIGDPLLGTFTLSLTAAKTALMKCGTTLYDASSIYEYDVELVAADASVLPVMWGKLRIHREVTRV